ncbi:hypothetical protein [Methylobacterium oxalidis]|uniref:hypothetical protein n=1 Tax=Methylobacterium oxalidis TaxID=944322 RepID=UPI003315A00C
MWSVADELAVTKRHLAEEEARRTVQIARVVEQIRCGQDPAAAEQALREAEAALVTLRARRSSLEAMQRHP